MPQHTCTEIVLFPIDATVPENAVRRSTVFSMSRNDEEGSGSDTRIRIHCAGRSIIPATDYLLIVNCLYMMILTIYAQTVT